MQRSAEQAEIGSTVAVSVDSTPGELEDWIGLYAVGAADHQYVDWRYLDTLRVESLDGRGFTAAGSLATVELGPLVLHSTSRPMA